MNIQGLTTERTCKIKSPEFISIYQSHDILLLTECWTSEDSDVVIDGFEHIILNRTEKKAGTKRNSGGIIVYIRSEYFDNKTFVKCENDDIIWIKLKDNVISDKPTYIALCYVLPAGTTRTTIVEESVFDRLLDTVVECESKHSEASFIICGDMNARTREMPDYVIHDTLQHIPLPDDYVLDEEILPRVSQDKNGFNSNGQQLLDFCKQTSLRIANGRSGADRLIGNFTCTTSRGQSVVDHVLMSRHLLQLVDTFDVGDPNILSDHSLISFSLLSSSKIQSHDCQPREGFVDYKYVWEADKLNYFKQNLGSQNCKQVLDNMKIELEQSIIFSNTIDDSIRTFTSVVEKCAKPLFQKNIYIHEPLEDDSRVHTSNAPWFDNECADNRYLFYRHLNLFRGNKSEVNRINLVQARSKYKASLRKARYKYDVQQTEKLNKLRYKNARDYWKLLKSVSTSGRANIPLTEFERYFKSVNNSNSKFYIADEDILLNNDRYIRGEIDVMFEELNLPITQREISKSIKQLKNNKSAGPDRLLNEFLYTESTFCSHILR